MMSSSWTWTRRSWGDSRSSSCCSTSPLDTRRWRSPKECCTGRSSSRNRRSSPSGHSPQRSCSSRPDSTGDSRCRTPPRGPRELSMRRFRTEHLTTSSLRGTGRDRHPRAPRFLQARRNCRKTNRRFPRSLRPRTRCTRRARRWTERRQPELAWQPPRSLRSADGSGAAGGCQACRCLRLRGSRDHHPAPEPAVVTRPTPLRTRASAVK